MAGMVFTPNNKNGIACVWAKTGGTDPMKGLWFSLNNYSKYFPYNGKVSKYDCCAQAVKERVEEFYSKK